MNGTWITLLVGSPALALIVKVTLLLGGGLLGSWLARGRSAATRHLVWLIAVAGSLAIAPLTLVAPRLVVDLPAPRLAMLSPTPASATGSATVPEGGARRPIVAPPPASHEAPLPRRAPAPAATWPARLTLALIWLAGALLVLLWSGLGHLAVRSLGRSARALEPERWRSLVAAESVAGRLAGRVTFGLSPALGTPLTWGWRRPVILLPAAATAWPAHRQRAALLHELAHVERRDYLAQMATTLACAVYWFHPLVWWSALRLRCESEHACDDRVLAAGTPAQDYASDLLEVARGARALHAVGLAAVGMARRSQLEGRLLAVLDEARPRRVFSTRAAAVAIASVVILLVPLAGLRPVVAGASPRDRAAPARAADTDGDRAGELSGRGTDSPPDDDTNAGRAGAPGEVLKDREGTCTVDAAAGERLTLDLETGGEVTIRGWDRPGVELRYRLGGRDWRDSRVVAERTGGGVRVHAYLVSHRWSSSTSHRFELKIPRRFDLKLRSGGGAVSLADVEGTFEGRTGGGEITIEHAKGRADLSTGGGEIHVSNSDLDGRVSTGGGTVTFSSVRGGLRGSSGSGPVVYSDGKGDEEGESKGDLGGVDVGPDGSHIGVARGQDTGFLHISRAGGEVNLDDAPAGAEITTGGGDVHVRHGAGDIRVRTGGGDIEVGPIAGSVWANTGGGDIRITLADAGGRKQTVDVSSGGGRIVLELPADLDARFDLETAYTRRSHETRINSVWTLDRDPVTDWDGRDGTPRRYVRAHGVAGNGRGLIRVKTVNGDIEVQMAAH